MIAIRLKKTGTKSRKQWRIIVADSRVSRSGRLIEEIGFYNPLTHPPRVEVQRDRYAKWIQKGAKPSKTVAMLMREKKRPADAN